MPRATRKCHDLTDEWLRVIQVAPYALRLRRRQSAWLTPFLKLVG